MTAKLVAQLGAAAAVVGAVVGWRYEAAQIRRARVDVLNMLGRSTFPEGSLLNDIVATVRLPLRHVATALAGLVVDGEVVSDLRLPARYRLADSP